MKEELEAELSRIKGMITKYDDQHKAAARMANIYRKQLKVLERDLSSMPAEKTPAESVQEISEGLK